MTTNPIRAPRDRRLKVLVLEDAPDIRRRLLPLVCGVPGLDVPAMARDVAEARELLLTLVPDLALLDLRLPDGSGLEILREVRAKNPAAFVAILTAFDEPRVRRTCLAAGADAFLSKVSGLDDLPALLASAVERGVRE